MARVTIEDCLEKVNNRFKVVQMANKRVKQLREGAEPLVSHKDNSHIVIALREIAEGKILLKEDEK